MGGSASPSGYDYSYSPSVTKRSAKSYRKDEGARYKGSSEGVQPPKKWKGKKKIKSNSPTPLVVAVDVTGSMGEWPEIIFEKLSVLYNEAKLHMPDIEISFAAVGDAYCDRQPIQICKFGKGKELDEMINKIYAEGGGGGQHYETYELVAYYYLKHCNIPKAKKPMFVFCGDEAFYDKVDAGHIRDLIGDNVKNDRESMKVMKDLCKKFDTYNLRIEYDNGRLEDEIHELWQNALGKQHVTKMEDPRRIVDCIIGMTAMAAGDWDKFEERITHRQTKKQVKQVMDTLKDLHPGKKKK
ncbi:MAG: hypothetical protein ACE5J7_04180 [Candidatus Aenigmatarchaeota archaeon]